jgi:PadR family transcriptional regulator
VVAAPTDGLAGTESDLALRHKVVTMWHMGEADGRRSQLLRGVLDICLLAVMSESPAYGYEMTKRLRTRGFSTVGEGSIYPLLGRLEPDGLVETRRAASNGGPPRKYYSLSPSGELALEAGRREWQMARDAVVGALDLVTVEVST